MTERINHEELDLQERVVAINRVSKTVKGGKNFRFAALVVVGDAKKNMIEVVIQDTTIPHEIIGRYGAGSVLLKPSKEGTGVIAGAAVRAVCELAGIKDIRTKCLGSNNPRNVVNATMAGLSSLKRPEDVAKMRGKSVDEILG